MIRVCPYMTIYAPPKSAHFQRIVSIKLRKEARTRLPSVGFRSRSRFLAVSPQVT